MRVSRNYDPSEGDKDATYRISFELTRAELLAGGWHTRFTEMWEHSRLAKDYLEFLAKFAGIMPQQEAQRQEAQRQQTNNNFESYYERVRRILNDDESLGGRAFYRKYINNDWDFGGFTSQQEQLNEPAWCKVLGLKGTATKQEIKAKYRELAKKWHPDRAGGNAAKMSEITNAYEEAIQ